MYNCYNKYLCQHHLIMLTICDKLNIVKDTKFTWIHPRFCLNQLNPTQMRKDNAKTAPTSTPISKIKFGQAMSESFRTIPLNYTQYSCGHSFKAKSSPFTHCRHAAQTPPRAPPTTQQEGAWAQPAGWMGASLWDSARLRPAASRSHRLNCPGPGHWAYNWALWHHKACQVIMRSFLFSFDNKKLLMMSQYPQYGRCAGGHKFMTQWNSKPLISWLWSHDIISPAQHDTDPMKSQIYAPHP